VPARLEDLLAKRLRQVAKEKGVPLSHVADRAGLARSYFWLLLDGSSSATLAAVQRLAEALEVEPLTLLSGAGRDATPVPHVRPNRPAKQAVAGSKARRPRQS
jgi:transcriptional regulator with XRE-family HTH domain